MENQSPSVNPEDKNARVWASYCHLSALLGFIIPFGNILGPLVIWLSKREKSSFVDEQGKEAINFQITLIIMYVVCFLLIFVFIGIPLIFALSIYGFIMVIVAAIKSNKGEHYQYSFILRLLK